MSSTEGYSNPLSAPPPRSVKIESTIKSKKKKSKQTILSNTGSPSTSPPPSASALPAANTPCRFFNLGQCNKGNACQFLHKKAAHFSPQACKFYTNGFCRNGDSCPFSHDPKILESASAAKESAASAPTIDDLVQMHEEPLSMSTSGDFSSSFDSSSFAGSFNDPHPFQEDNGSFQDQGYIFSQPSSLDEGGGLHTGATSAFSSPYPGPVGGEPFSLYGPPPTSTVSTMSNPQLHQLIHSTTSPRSISSRESSSEFLTSSSYGSNSASSDSSPPTYVAPSPIHSQPPPGGVKLGRTITTSATFSLTTPPPTTATQTSPRPLSYSPQPTDGSGDHLGAVSSNTSNASKPAPFRRQSSAQLSQSPTNPLWMMSSYSPVPIAAPMSSGTPANGRPPPLSSSGGKPAPFNRSRSTDHALVPPKRDRMLMGLYVSEDEPTYFSRVPPLASLPHFAQSGLGDYLATQDDLTNNGNITPSSTASSSSIFDSTSIFHISPRSRQSVTSSSGARPGSSLGNNPSIFGDFDSYSELGTSDEDDVMFWDNPQWHSSSASASGTTSTSYGSSGLAGIGAAKISTASTSVAGAALRSSFVPSGGPIGGLLTPYEKAIEGLLDDPDVGAVPLSPATSTSGGAAENRARTSSNSSTSDSLGKVSASPASSMGTHGSQLLPSASGSSIPNSPLTSSVPLNHSMSNTSTTSGSSAAANNMAERRRAMLLASGSGSATSLKTSGGAPVPLQTTLSPSSSRSSFGLAPGGPPIPRLSRTRKGSFSKSHEDLLANRESPLQSPLYVSASVSGGFGFTASPGSSIGSTSELLSPSSSNPLQEDWSLASPQWHANEPILPQRAQPPVQVSYQAQNQTQTQSQALTPAQSYTVQSPLQTQSSSSSMAPHPSSSATHQQPPASHQGPGKRAIPPMLGSLKSQSTARLSVGSSSILSTGPSPMVPPPASSATASPSGMPGVARTAPKISRLGKSHSEAGPGSAMMVSITAWKERANAAASIASMQLALPPGGGGAPKSGTETPTSALASPSSQSSRKQQLCMFYIEGTCRYGENCKFVHGLVCLLCKKPCLFPEDPQQNEKHAKTCRLKIEIEESKDLTCALCKLKVVEANRKFGLLPDCDDVICVPCLKEYRTSTSKAECPVCQAPSHFLIPSHSFPQNPERKRELTDAFKLKMSKIACKYFDHGNGVCKYGQLCHFHHNVETTPTPTTGQASSTVQASPQAASHHQQLSSSSTSLQNQGTPSSSRPREFNQQDSAPSSFSLRHDPSRLSTPSIMEASPEEESSPATGRRQH